MDLNPGVIAGIGIGLVLIIIARRWDKRRHEDRLKHIQDRISRRQSRMEGGTNREAENEKGTR